LRRLDRVIDPGIILASEHFANIAERVHAGFISVGAQTRGGGAHAPDFDIDKRAIGLSAEILARTALARLGR
jgi:metal-dependent amidase/aminoacylase/carboxypeptidase family protein